MKQPLNEQFRRMQKLAGIITEGQLSEGTKHQDLKTLEDVLLKNGYSFEGDDIGFSGKATYEKKVDDLNTNEISLFGNYEVDMGPEKGKTFPVRILYFIPGKDYTFENGKKLNRGHADISYESIDKAKKEVEGVSKL